MRRARCCPLALFRRRNFTFANVETFTVYAALSVQSFFLVLFLQQLAGYSPFRSGLATVPITVVMFFLSGRVGRLSMRYGPRLFMGSGPLVCAGAMVWLRSLSPGFDYWTALLPPLLVFSLGLSLIVAPLTATVLADAGPGDAGIASGVNNAVARIAGLLGIAIVGAAIASGSNRLDLPGFRHAMAITARLVAAGGIVGVAGIRNVEKLRIAPAAEGAHDGSLATRRSGSAQFCRTVAASEACLSFAGASQSLPVTRQRPRPDGVAGLRPR